MSFTNKLIEAIAENFIASMTEILERASEYGDTATLEQVAEVMRDAGYRVIEDDEAAERDKRVAELVRCARPFATLHVNAAEPLQKALAALTEPGTQGVDDEHGK